MSARSWILGASVVVSACIAIGCSFYVLSGGGVGAGTFAALGLALALGLVSATLLALFNSTDVRSVRHGVRTDIAGFDRRLRDDRGRNETLSLELAELRDMSNRNAQSISRGIADLKDGYAVLNEQLRTTISTVSNFQSARTFAAQQGFARTPFAVNGNSNTGGMVSPPFGSHVEQVEHQPVEIAQHAPLFANSMSYSSFAQNEVETATAPTTTSTATATTDQLVISLEPVIDLFTSKTAHYRLHLAMAKPEGGEIAQDVLFHHADRTGIRSDFDLHAAREALQLLRRLRQRDPGLNIFMGVGPTTLQSDAAVLKLLGEIRDYSDVSAGLVFELPHAMLAGLPDAGLEGLAKLARAGVPLSLSNVAIGGIDFAPLSTLNVRFLSLTAVAAGGADGPTPALLSFAQSARVARIQTVVTGVVDRRVIQRLTKLTRFACGPVFAEPRRVKAGATMEASPASYSVGAAA